MRRHGAIVASVASLWIEIHPAESGPASRDLWKLQMAGMLILSGVLDFGPLAQLVEQRPFKPRVAGSNPARLTFYRKHAAAEGRKKARFAALVTLASPSSSLAQDTGLSRRRHGFKSRRGRQFSAGPFQPRPATRYPGHAPRG